jgi:hypothetical protein
MAVRVDVGVAVAARVTVERVAPAQVAAAPPAERGVAVTPVSQAEPVPVATEVQEETVATAAMEVRSLRRFPILPK